MKNNDEFIQLKDENTYTKNIFTSPLGHKYAKQLFDIYNNMTLANRDELMKKFYEEGKNDSTLSDNQKKIISGCYVAYLIAIGKTNLSMPLILYVKNKKPNLSKCLTEKRIKRVIEDLYSFMERSGFKFECYNIFDLLKRFLQSFSQTLNHKDNEDPTFELYLIIALSKFARALPIMAYNQIWFVLMFIKNISLLSFVNINMINNDIINEAKNLIKLINIIHVLELQRTGVILQTKEEQDNQEKSVILPNENIKIENNLITEEKIDDNNIEQKKEDNKEKVLNPESYYSPIIESQEDLEKIIT